MSRVEAADFQSPGSAAAWNPQDVHGWGAELQLQRCDSRSMTCSSVFTGSASSLHNEMKEREEFQEAQDWYAATTNICSIRSTSNAGMDDYVTSRSRGLAMDTGSRMGKVGNTVLWILFAPKNM
eukprot:scpid90109/ scgid32094/ 